MHAIILPGSSKEYNERWLYDSEKAYKDLFDGTTTMTYEWWEEGSEDKANQIDPEVEKLSKIAEKVDGDYVIIAKSVGTLITVKAVSDGKISPKKCVFMGSPWGDFAEKQGSFENSLEKFTIPTLFIQQTNDMFFRYQELEEVVNGSKVTDYKMVEVPGEDHSYTNYDEIKGWVKDFLAA